MTHTIPITQFLGLCVRFTIFAAAGLCHTHDEVVLLQAVCANQGSLAVSVGPQGFVAVVRHALFTAEAAATSALCYSTQHLAGMLLLFNDITAPLGCFGDFFKTTPFPLGVVVASMHLLFVTLVSCIATFMMSSCHGSLTVWECCRYTA